MNVYVLNCLLSGQPMFFIVIKRVATDDMNLATDRGEVKRNIAQDLTGRRNVWSEEAIDEDDARLQRLWSVSF